MKLSPNWWVGVAILLFNISTARASSNQNCNSLLSKGMHLKSIQCYTQILQKMKPTNKLSLLEKKEKALYYKKISYSYRQLAKAQATDEGKSYFFERSAEYLARVYQEKLCGKAIRCRLLRGQEAELRKEIRYSTLTLVHSDGSKATIVLKGYQYNRKGLGQVLLQTKSLQLRPGTYTLTIIRAGKPEPPQTQTIQLEPGKSTTVTISQLIVVRSNVVSKRGSYILLGVGAGLFTIGSALLVAGYLFQSNANSEAGKANSERTPAAIGSQLANLGSDPTRQQVLEALDGKLSEWQTSAANINSSYSTGSAMLVSGWPIASVGLAGAVAGLVWLGAISGSSTTSKQTNLPPSSSFHRVGRIPNLDNVYFHLQVR